MTRRSIVIAACLLALLAAASPASAATVTKTWTFATDAEGLADAGAHGQVDFVFVSGDGNPAGSVGFATAQKNLAAASELARRATTGETWESWGVPAGSTVTGVQITAWSERTAGNTKLTSHSIAMRIVDSLAATVHSAGDLISADPGTGVDGTWQAGTAGAARAVDAAAQLSTTDVRLELQYTVTTSGGGGSAVVDQRFDQIQLTITYTAGNPPPTVAITAPASDGAAIGGPSGYTVTGTASDPGGSVSAVDVRIRRLDNNQYWNGTGWTASETWNPASGTTAWDYAWNWTLDMDAVSVSITARATDNLGATGTATRSATADSKAPVNTVPVHLTPDNTPLSGEALTLSSSWTEASPGSNVPEFQWTLNGATTGWSSADSYAGGVASRTTGVTLNGDDAITLVASRFTDTFGNGPTLSSDGTTVYVLPLTPQTPVAANNGTTTSLDVSIQPNLSETGAVWYAIQCYNSGGTPTGWVQSNPGGCGGGQVWQDLGTWGAPVVVTGLSAATTYRFATAAGNPSDSSPTTGENSASIYTVQASATTSATAADDVTVSPPTAAVNACTQITVSVTFTGDDNANSTTLFERSPNGVDTWSPVTSCGAGDGVVSGPSPRVCVDTTVAASSVNYYRVDFTDADGVNGTDPSAAIGPYDTTPYCGVDGTTIGTVTAEASSCNQITLIARFSGDDDDDGSIQVEWSPAGEGTWTTACASTTGASPRQCLIPGLDPSASYDLQVTFSDPDGVAPDTNLTPTTELVTPTPATVATAACGTDVAAPALLVLAPSRGAIVGGVDRAKVQVFDAGMDTTPLASVEWSVDSSNDLDLAAATENANYDCGTDCAVYEFDLDTTALAQGSHYLTLKAVDAGGNVARLAWGFRVNNSGPKAAGDGFLLRRSHGSQMCLDCHNLKTHSSQSTSSDHGNWAVGCVACHTPHRTENIYLIRETVETPNSGKRPVRFEARTGAVASSSTPGTASFANEDNATQSDGICQACHTRTSDSSGTLARWRNAASGGNEDSHYASAATSQCTGCHTHEAGFSGAGGACNSCHFAPPTVGKHGSHDQIGELPTSYTNLTPTTTPTQYGFACAKCHSGTHFSDPSTPHTVDVTFDETVDPTNAGGAYAPATAETPDPGVNGDGWNWSKGTCSNLYCHSNAAPLAGTDSRKTPTWDQAVTLTCASCHSTAARDDGGAVTDLSDTHGKHIQSASDETGSYTFTCDECHAQTIKDAPANPWALSGADFSTAAGQGKVQHVDGGKDVFFSTTATAGSIDQSGGSYAGSPSHTCSNTYCHSPGTKTSGFDPPVGTALAWDGGVSNCRSCHAGDHTASPTMDSGKHENHVNNASVIGTNYVCATCHNATVSSGSNTTITTIASHVNGAKNIAGTRVDATYTSPTCTSSYCHSSGQAPNPPSTTSFEYYTTPDWFTATVDALDCKGCHGRHSENAFASVAGEPNYTNDGAGAADANSHSRHVSAAADCTKCHNATTTTGTAILASAPHTDQNRDVVIAPAFDTNGGSSNYTTATKTCSGVACHGSGTPQWGATLTCLACHSGTEGGTLGDGTPNGVAGEWLSDGHGSSAGGSLSSALGGCDYCHQLDAAHTPTTSTNPYRLRFTTTDNTLCLQCHGGGEDGTGDNGISQNSAGTALTSVDSSLDVDTAHFGTKHAGTEGGKLCWDCHDPHGVPSNILMVKSLVSKNASAYGVPGTTVTVNFTDNTTPGLAVGHFVENTNTPRTGICQACHDPAGQGASGPTDYWRSNGTVETHNPTLLCSSCHFHNNNFAGAGGDCLGCHGNAGDAGTQGPNSRRPVRGDFGKNSHHVGASVDANGNPLFSQPTMGGALTNFDCVVCHAEGRVNAGDTEANDTLHKNGVIDLRNTDVADGGAGYYYSYARNSITGASNTWMSGNASWETQTVKLDRFCLSCHDANGASATFNSGVDEGRGFSGSATNPFADTAVANEYDQVDRVAVVNIRNKVDAYVNDSNTPITPIDRDQVGEARGPDGRVDPTQGIYSRHAIRSDSPATFGAPSVYQADSNASCTAAGTPYTCCTGSGAGTCEGMPDNRWVARPVGTTGSWNDNSVMGCADCHTTDGANTTDGNAHGSNTEYLLKNKDGSASIEAVWQDRDLGSTINCYKCHIQSWYSRDVRNFEHTDNNGDWAFTSPLTGSTNRRSGNGNVFGLPCMNCHGGTGFGRIHGTTETLLINAGPATRKTYRFANGASQRYFDPNNWTTGTFTCYTLTNAQAATDSWGGCAQHDQGGSGATYTRFAPRPLKY